MSESDGENSPEVKGALDDLDPTEYLIMKKNVCNLNFSFKIFSFYKH